ncbi:MAG TPA: ABC transporter ATP-binding protein [Trebonia sp.]|nr:ABC transporter ATP-binding protein [Trebonia sp.]
MLEADIRLRLSRLNLDAAFTVAAGEVVALLGPNGSGKSTILRALTGLLPLAGGRVVLDGTVLEDPAERVMVAPEKRPIALMFQDYLLFPHMNAVENVAFGLRCQGVDKKTARERAATTLGRLELGEVAEAKPGAMSGGQQQRVAMARALVTDPKLLLLDEPLAALDVSIKTNVRRLLRDVLSKSSAANMLVTHDVLDAVALSDRMIVIENGGIVQTGTPAEVTGRPRSRYVADLTGVNLLAGTARGTLLDVDGGGRLVCAESATGPTLAVIAPAGVAVSRHQPEGRRENAWQGKVSAVDLMGARVRVHVDGTPAITAEVPPAAVDELKLDDGGELWVSIEPAAITTYPQ